MSSTKPLLVEIRTEELPPAQLWGLAIAFPRFLSEALQKEGFSGKESVYLIRQATPRRLTARISEILAESPAQEIVRRGPQIAACKDAEGTPTKALIGFMQSVSATCENDLTTVTEKGKEYIAWRGESPARKLSDELAAIVERVLLSLPAPRLMRWGANEFKFIRPVRGVLLLHGKEHISGNVMGVPATKTTKGHPFLSAGDIEITDADSYADVLKKHYVIVDMDERMNMIADKIVELAEPYGGFKYEDSSNDEAEKISLSCNFLVLGDEDYLYSAISHGLFINEKLRDKKPPFKRYAYVSPLNELLREVCAMCEFPTVHLKIMDEKFRSLPWQCISECIQKHQRFLPMFFVGCKITYTPHNQESKWYLSDPQMRSLYFIVSDNVPITSEDQAGMLLNYDTVLNARLNDVLFYYEEDQKTPPEIYVEKLKNIIFHKKLGSQHDRVERICKIAENLKDDLIYGQQPVNPTYIETPLLDMTDSRTQAEMFLASLPTQMVGEYPSLQGAMSSAYFGMSKENMRIFSILYGMEKLVGLFGIGEKPTSSKDPHGLRKEAMIFVRSNTFYLFPNPKQIIDAVTQSFDGKIDDVTEDVHDFLLDRFRFLLSQRYRVDSNFHKIVDAVLSQKLVAFWMAHNQINALNKFMLEPECETLAAASKRIKNIFRKSKVNPAELPLINPDLFSEDAERELYRKLNEVQQKVKQKSQSSIITSFAMLQDITPLAPFIDSFFDKVLVNADKGQIRLNRFALLAELRDLLNTVGDLSYLAK